MKKKIKHLLKQRKAIMLAHNYQPPEIQDLADLCGDSLELSIKASETDAEVIVFCGVHFMAETASILSPDKTVLLPRQDAGCPMADMITPDGLKEKIGQLSLMPVVTYVNSPASVKAMSTICCTSANAVAVVNSLDAKEIMMVPDRNLSHYAALQTGRRIHIWNGYCPVHDRLTVTDVQNVKHEHPEALFMAHPECRPEVLELADAVLSTSGMLRFPGKSKNRSFIVGTETGLLYSLKKTNPDVDFYPASEKMVCPDMKRITLDDVARSLEFMEGEVRVEEHTRRPALKAVKRMLDLS
ncbi:MAG: quinolinate synthase NadA [Deltaproteobacteria bacterium]|nr:quinolinate synthase NadA [Deltaproteobacteria bacterium]MBW2199823.1 quinolinate synthase NadA [Deltaproteobacteria bacterium]MBW2538869.1 quinolinate synthase NadA [Deltaproteobacteria bacterium]